MSGEQPTLTSGITPQGKSADVVLVVSSGTSLMLMRSKACHQARVNGSIVMVTLAGIGLVIECVMTKYAWHMIAYTYVDNSKVGN
jgi:hypothetical protein